MACYGLKRFPKGSGQAMSVAGSCMTPGKSNEANRYKIQSLFDERAITI